MKTNETALHVVTARGRGYRSAGCVEPPATYGRAGPRLSVTRELQQLRAALDGARLLMRQIGDGEDPASSSAASQAVIELVDLRMRDLCRTIEGDLDPAEMLAEHNRMLSSDDGGRDIVFAPWNADDRRARCESLERDSEVS